MTLAFLKKLSEKLIKMREPKWYSHLSETIKTKQIQNCQPTIIIFKHIHEEGQLTTGQSKAIKNLFADRPVIKFLKNSKLTRIFTIGFILI